MKKLTALFLIAALIFALSGCKKSDGGEITTFKFSDSVNTEAILALNGKKVSISGYMATLSPISGKFIYLMNMPYQSCPFCVPYTTELANTIAVYAKSGDTFDFTDRPIKVTGTLEVGDFTDEFSYEYKYRIADAAYEVVDLSKMSEEYALWLSISEEGLAAEINDAFNYVYFACFWNEYQGTSTLEDGSTQTWNMYPDDVSYFMQQPAPYGYKEKSDADYFPSLVRRARAISPTGLEDLVKVINDMQALVTDALKELTDGRYTYIPESDTFALTAEPEITMRYTRIYSAFNDWLGKWEM